MKDNLIEKWEKGLFIISIIVLLIGGLLERFDNSLTTSYPTIISIITGLFSGFIATISVLYLQRRHDQNQLKNDYLKYQGCY